MLKIAERTVGAISILDCAGRITLGEGSSTFRDKIKELLDKNRKYLVLNMAIAL